MDPSPASIVVVSPLHDFFEAVNLELSVLFVCVNLQYGPVWTMDVGQHQLEWNGRWHEFASLAEVG